MAQAKSDEVVADPQDTLAVLKAAEEWLSDPERWTQGYYWRGADGCIVVEASDVHQTCATGALALVAGLRPWNYDHTPAFDALWEATVGHPGVVNDERGYDAVMEGYRKAIEAIEAKR